MELTYFLIYFSAYKNDSGRNRRTDLYLKENEHLRRYLLESLVPLKKS